MQLINYFCDLCNNNKNKIDLTTFTLVEQSDYLELCHNCVKFIIVSNINKYKLRYNCEKCKGTGKIHIKGAWTGMDHEFEPTTYKDCECGPR